MAKPMPISNEGKLTEETNKDKTVEDKSDRDIVDRLMDSQPKGSTSGYLLNNAADEIVRLRKLLKIHILQDGPRYNNPDYIRDYFGQ
jgi:hypothetical protein